MSLNTASLRSSLHAYLQVLSTRQDLSTPNLNLGAELIRKADTGVESVQVKETSITESKVLADEGKRLALAELATAAVPRFAWLGRVVEGQESEMADKKKTLYVVKAPDAAGDDPLLRYLYGKEIRDRYQGLSQQDKDMAFVKAAEVSDSDEQANRDAILWAFQETPSGPMITANILQRALEERAKRTQPAVVNRLHETELLHEVFSGVRDAVVNWLRGLGGDQVKIFAELGGEEPVMSAKDTELARRQVHSAA